MQKRMSKSQKDLFKAIEASGDLVYAGGPKGAVANLVGHFKVEPNHHDEDQLNVNDGTHHVHIDWSRLKKAVVGESSNEGTLSFFDEDEFLFKLYRLAGPFNKEVESKANTLTPT